MDEINCHEIDIKHIIDNYMRINDHTFYKIKTIFLPFSVSLSKLLLDPKRANFNKISIFEMFRYKFRIKVSDKF